MDQSRETEHQIKARMRMSLHWQAAQCEDQKKHRKRHGPPNTTDAQEVYLNQSLHPKTPIHIQWWPHFTLVLIWACIKGVRNRDRKSRNCYFSFFFLKIRSGTESSRCSVLLTVLKHLHSTVNMCFLHCYSYAPTELTPNIQFCLSCVSLQSELDVMREEKHCPCWMHATTIIQNHTLMALLYWFFLMNQSKWLKKSFLNT